MDPPPELPLLPHNLPLPSPGQGTPPGIWPPQPQQLHQQNSGAHRSRADQLPQLGPHSRASKLGRRGRASPRASAGEPRSGAGATAPGGLAPGHSRPSLPSPRTSVSRCGGSTSWRGRRSQRAAPGRLLRVTAQSPPHRDHLTPASSVTVLCLSKVSAWDSLLVTCVFVHAHSFLDGKVCPGGAWLRPNLAGGAGWTSLGPVLWEPGSRRAPLQGDGLPRRGICTHLGGLGAASTKGHVSGTRDRG